MINLPKRAEPQVWTNCCDCKDNLTKDNRFMNRGLVNKRCKPCNRKYHNVYNKKRAKALKEGKLW